MTTPAAAASGRADGKSFFYTPLDENHRPSKVFHHMLGTPQSQDRLVYEEKDPGFFMGVGGSLLDDFIYHRHPRPRDVGIPAAVRPRT